MTIQRILGGLGIAVMPLLLASCVNSSATIDSKKVAAGSGAITRMLIFADVGSVFKNKNDGDEEQIFATDFAGSLNQCGIATSYQIKRSGDGTLTLDDNAKKADDRGLSSSNFGADTVFDIQRLSETKSTKAASSAVYALSITDVKAGKLVWTAQMTFVSAWYGGQRFAATLVDRLKQDNIIPASCVTPTVPKA